VPYRDPEQQREYNRRWHRERLDLCPLCADLKTPGFELCKACRDHQRMVDSRPRGVFRQRDTARVGVSRPQPANHPWRQSLTRQRG